MGRNERQRTDRPRRRATGAVPHGRGVDLNHAGIDQLAGLPAVDRTRADNLMRHRPLKSWADLARIPGFDEAMVDDLKRSGAHL